MSTGTPWLHMVQIHHVSLSNFSYCRQKCIGLECSLLSLSYNGWLKCFTTANPFVNSHEFRSFVLQFHVFINRLTCLSFLITHFCVLLGNFRSIQIPFHFCCDSELKLSVCQSRQQSNGNKDWLTACVQWEY